MRQSSFWQGRGGTVEHAISGIDIALWDLFGKICNQPVSRLLGGVYRDRIQPYGSMLFDEPDVLAQRLQQVVARGFKAIKLGWRPFGRRGGFHMRARAGERSPCTHCAKKRAVVAVRGGTGSSGS